MARTGSAEVAKEVLAYCSSCKMDLAATVIAMKGDQIAKVECKTCKKERAYKAPKGITEPGQAPAKKTRAKKAKAEEKNETSIQAEWQKVMAAHKAAPNRSYSPKTSFAIGDKIAHSTFGEGIVTRHIYPNKMEILFEMDLKILIHAGAK